MTQKNDDHSPGRLASPPCLAGEIAPDYFDPLAVDAQQVLDVVRWRKAERARLLAARQAMRGADRRAVGEAMVAYLRRLLETRRNGTKGQVLSAYWPIKGEPNLRALMSDLHTDGVTIALPVVEEKGKPLVFRRWTPDTRMVRGHWNIPVPPVDADRMVPDIAFAPLVGWAPGGRRLGYGGGYFDRALDQLSPRPFSIGVGLQAARVETIYPQPHDIRLDAIVTEMGVEFVQD